MYTVMLAWTPILLICCLILFGWEGCAITTPQNIREACTNARARLTAHRPSASPATRRSTPWSIRSLASLFTPNVNADDLARIVAIEIKPDNRIVESIQQLQKCNPKRLYASCCPRIDN